MEGKMSISLNISEIILQIVPLNLETHHWVIALA